MCRRSFAPWRWRPSDCAIPTGRLGFPAALGSVSRWLQRIRSLASRWRSPHLSGFELVQIPFSMYTERPSILVLPSLQSLPEIGFDFGQVFGDPLAHLLLPQQFAGVTLLTLGSFGHQSTCIVTTLLEIVTFLDETPVFVDSRQD